MEYSYTAVLTCARLMGDGASYIEGAEWSKLVNVDISGGGTINGNGDQWWQQCLPTCPDGTDTTERRVKEAFLLTFLHVLSTGLLGC